MKKFLSLLLAAIMLWLLVACSFAPDVDPGAVTAEKKPGAAEPTDRNDPTDPPVPTKDPDKEFTDPEPTTEEIPTDEVGGDVGGEDPAEEYPYLTFTLLENDTYGVCSNNDMPDVEREKITEVVIPSHYRGKRVTRILGGAFHYWNNVRQLTLSEGIEEIENDCFIGLNIQALVLPEGMITVGASFHGCALLKEITLPGSLKKIELGAFQSCAPEVLRLSDLGSFLAMDYPEGFFHVTDIYVNGALLTDLVVPADVTRIGGQMLSRYQKLKTIRFAQDSVCEFIGNGAFQGCDQLTSVRFPDSILYVGSSVLENSEYVLRTDLLTLYHDYYYVGSDTNPYLACIGAVDWNTVQKYSNDFHPDMKVISRVASWQTVYCDVVSYRGGYYVGGEENPYRILVSADRGFTLHPQTEIVAGDAFLYFWGSGRVYVPSEELPRTFAYAKGENNEIQTVYLNKIEASPLTYALSADGKGYVVTGFVSGQSVSEVYVPATYQGLPVVAIGKQAFANAGVTSIYLPDSVRSIGAEAFYACESLTDLMLGEGLFIIDRAAFRYCRSLSDVNLPNGVAIIEYEAFADCTALSTFRMSKGIMKVGSDAFRDCSVLNAEKIGPAIIQPWLGGSASYSGILDHTTIAENAFDRESAEALTWINLPNSVKYIGAYAFDACTSLKYYEYGGGKYMGNDFNPFLVFVGMDDRTLSSFELHPDTKIIRYRAFQDCVNLRSITIPQGVVSIGYEAFAGCSSLESVSLPASVEFVDDMAFFQCTKLNHLEFGSLRVLGDKSVWWCVELKSIHFRGTVAEWESVYKYETWYGNTVLDSVICSDGTVTLK